ncbi:MAG: penicillin-binding protein 2 [Legionellaceae bacterium]|nr:penicillin-binding protein 2 [Legionellaceae bacterium]
MSYTRETSPMRMASRWHFLYALVCLLCLLLLIQLIHLQIIDYAKYHTLSLKNQIRIIPMPPPRGVIVDRNGVLIAENKPVFALEIIPEHVNLEKTLPALQRLLPSISNEDIQTFQHIRKQHPSFASIPIKMQLTPEEIARFAVNQYHFPGVSLKARLIRYYPFGALTSHVVGFVGRINLSELKQLNPTNYEATNFVGKTGVEKFYEDRLHGKIGAQRVETDVNGRMIRVLDKIPSQSGEKLILTLDMRLQSAIYDLMKDKQGAVILMNVQGGEILAMVSTPSFDPNLFVQGIPQKEFQQLNFAKDRPLFHRAVRGVYPPASTIKPFIGLTGLEKNVIDTRYSIYDPGWFQLPGIKHVYHDWNKKGHGFVNLSRAITVSCDPYFYQLGHKLGIHAMDEMLHRFGFGEKSSVDLYEEASGLVPNDQWKRKNKGVSWYPGDSLITAIGQGFMLASPLQLVHAVATISLRGVRYQPHLLKAYEDLDTHHIYPARWSYKPPVQISDPHYWDIIIDAMHAVTTSNEGTGYRFGRNPPYSVAAKTGTAQVFGGKAYELHRTTNTPDYLRDNSLFLGFTPVENPEVAIIVVVEHDVLASTIARAVLDTYYHLYHNYEPKHA